MNEDLSIEISALEQALEYIERSGEALDARDEAHRRRMGVYAHDRLGRGELGLMALRIRNERDRLRKQLEAAV